MAKVLVTIKLKLLPHTYRKTHSCENW